jgi:PadR family transcriptional regulator, regulatory protein AphA
VVVSSSKDLPATSFAMLGQLALRPWSVYEMTQNVGRTLHWFWPRAESVLYAEVKRLTKLGFAKGTTKPGARGRDKTVYSITAAGRRALREWLKTKPNGVSLHSEPILRIHLSPWGTKQNLMRALEAEKAHAESLIRVCITVGTEFAEGRHQFQDQVHIRAILFDVLWAQGISRYLSAERCLEKVKRWPDIKGSAAAKREGVEAIAEELGRLPASLLDGPSR